MPRYTAQNQSIGDNVGIASVRRPMVDVGGAIQELGQAGSSLVHQFYLREMAKRQQQERADARVQEQQRWETDRADRREERESRDQLDRQKLNIDALKNGIDLGSEGGATVTESTPTPTIDQPAQKSIAGAMTQGMRGPQGAPAPQSSLQKPVTPGSLGRIPDVTVGEEAPTAPSIDPTKAVGYQTANVRAQSAAEVARIRGETTVKARQIMAGAQVQSAGIRARGTVKAAETRANSKSSTNGGADATDGMTPNQRAQHFKTVVAPALLQLHGGDLGAAIQDLQGTPEGQAWVKKGFGPEYLASIYAGTVNKDAAVATGLTKGDDGLPVDSAVARVKDVRKKMTGPPITKQLDAKPGSAAKPIPTQQYDDEAAKYQGAVAKAKTRLKGKELNDMLKKLNDHYNSKVGAIAGVK